MELTSPSFPPRRLRRFRLTRTRCSPQRLRRGILEASGGVGGAAHGFRGGPRRSLAGRSPAGGSFGLFREGESLKRRFKPLACFESLWAAQLVAALLPGLGRDAAYRFKEEREPEGWAIQSREAWREVIGHVEVFEPALIAALQVGRRTDSLASVARLVPGGLRQGGA